MPDICPICEGSGHRITTDPGGNRFAQECSCRVELRVDRALAQARIPARYHECTLDTYEFDHPSLSSAFLIAHRFATGYPVSTQGRGILFTVSSCLVKTLHSISILKYVIAQRGATGFFWEHKELLDRLRSIYSLRTAGAEDKLLRSLITCDLLVLDDLGDMTPSDWSWDTTSYILNSRYNENLSTIITTNLPNQPSFAPAPGEERSARADLRRALSRETLADRIGERMRSRLQEMCVVVEMEGGDFRQRTKRASFG